MPVDTKCVNLFEEAMIKDGHVLQPEPCQLDRHGITTKGAAQIYTNQEAIFNHITTTIAGIDGAANAQRAQVAAAECERNASLCAESAARAQSAEEVTSAAAPILEELKAMRAEVTALKTQLAKVEDKQKSQCECIIS